MKKIFKAVLAAIYQVKARSSLDFGSYDKSLHYVDKFKSVLGKETFYILLIEGSIYFRESDYQRAASVMRSVLEKLKSNKRLDPDSKKYLMAHAAYIINFSIVHGSLKQDPVSVDIDFDLDKVKRIYKDQYTVFIGENET